MGNFAEYLLVIIRSLIWPPKGIILFEEQVLQWCYATLKVYLLMVGIPRIMIAFAVYAIVMFVVFERSPHHMGHAVHHGVRHVIGFIFRLLFVILFGWVMLIYGAVGGGLRGEGPENDPRATQNVNINIFRSRLISVTQSFTRLSWHFRIGRWLFRAAYGLLGHIGIIADRPRLHRYIARGIALFIIVYKAWEIPYLLTH